MRFRTLAALLLALSLVAAACGDDDDSAATDGGDTAASCALADLALVTPGVLTVATGEPAFPPWVSGPDGANFDDPASGTGFEAALVYALADEMGFAADDVVWVRTGFDEAIAPGPKDYDFNLQQYSITAAREEVVDFSAPYYTTKQALVAFPDSAVVGATSLADLKDVTLGAQIGTTSLDFIEDVIQPTTQASVYDSNVDAKSGLEAGQIDGIIVDLPTAYYITAVEIEGSVIVAEFEAAASAPDQFGLLFSDGSALRVCVDEALETLRSNGTLDALEDEWLVSAGGLVSISG
jgi:polar amino acid transport system substrate-binding protein